MSEWASNFGSIVGSSSRYFALGGTFGAIATLAAPWLHLDPHVAGLAGFCLPFGPLYFYFGSARQVRKQLELWKHWYDEGLISEAQFNDFQAKTLRWYSERLHGKAESESPVPRTTKGPGEKPAGSAEPPSSNPPPHNP